VVTEAGRSYVRRTEAEYDVIDVALTEPQRTIVSGAYSLAENDSMTVEAFVDRLERLAPDGLLVVTRWLQVPPSESIRAFALVVEAVERAGGTPETDLVALRSYRQMMILARRSAFTGAELQTVRSFAEERRFDLVYLPCLHRATLRLAALCWMPTTAGRGRARTLLTSARLRTTGPFSGIPIGGGRCPTCWPPPVTPGSRSVGRDTWCSWSCSVWPWSRRG
jgi:hypothetical protein